MGKNYKVTLEITKPRKNPYTVLREEVKKAIPAVQQVLYEEAQKEAADLRLDILQQRRDWPDLSPAYLKWKKRKGKDQRILIADGYYVNAIQARKRPWGNAVEVGLPKTEHPEAGVPYEVLAKWLEYGVVKTNLPPRPHWGPARERAIKHQARIGKRIDQKFASTVFKGLAAKVGTQKKTTKK